MGFIVCDRFNPDRFQSDIFCQWTDFFISIYVLYLQMANSALYNYVNLLYDLHVLSLVANVQFSNDFITPASKIMCPEMVFYEINGYWYSIPRN